MAVSPIRLYAPNADIQIFAAADLQSLANGAEVEAVLANGTNLDLWVTLMLAVQYAAGPPSAGTKIAEIYQMEQVNSQYPSVTSGGLPQKALLAAALESVAPSTTALEYLESAGIPLAPGNNKFRLSNTSGQAYHGSASMWMYGKVYQLGAGT